MIFMHETFSLSVKKKTTEEHSYTIPSGKTLALDRFSGGHEYCTKEVRVELVSRLGNTDDILMTGYGGAFDFDMGIDIVGDGSRAIVIRLVSEDSGWLHMTGHWRGRVK